MLNLIPPQYLLLAKIAALGALLLGTAWLVADYKDRGHRAEIAEMSAKAEALRADLETARAEKEAADAQHSRDIQAERDKNREQIAASGDAFELDLAKRVRDAERRARRGCQLPGAATGAGVPEGTDAGDEGGYRPDVAGRIRAVRDVCRKLQVDLGEAQKWAVGVGR